MNAANKPPGEPVVPNCPVGYEFEPCNPELVQPIVSHLRAGDSIEDELAFPRGTHLADGRLDLCKQQIGPVGTQMVADAAASNRHTRHLLMGANGMGSQGAMAVAKAIRQSNTLETVYLGCNLIDEQGACDLAEAVEHSSSVKALWLKRNPIGLEGAKRIARMLSHNTRLRTLDLVHTDLTPDGVRLIVEALTKPETAVRRLYLGGNQITADQAGCFAELLRTNRSLHSLYLSVNRLGDTGAAVIADALGENQSLQAISLASNGIGPTGAETLANALRAHPCLRYFDLGYDRSTKVLGERPNAIEDAGAFTFANLLADNQVMCVLDLRNNSITNRGLRRLAVALEENVTLMTLQIGRRFSRELKRRVRELLQRNRAASTFASLPDAEDLRAIRSVYRTVPVDD